MSTRRPATVLLVILALFSVRGDETEWVVGSITFDGNDHIGRRELLQRMSLHSPGYFTKARYSFSRLVDDISELGDVYYDRGFLHASIDIDTVILDSSRQQAEVKLLIDEGAPTRIAKITAVGNPDVVTGDWREYVAVEPGDRLDSLDLALSGEALSAQLAQQGHLLGAVSYDVELDSSRYDASVVYSIVPGPVVLAGGVEIVGFENLTPEVIQRELVFGPGDTLTPIVIEQSIRQLYRSGLFDDVRIEPLTDLGGSGTGGAVRVPVFIGITEKDMFAYRAGGGYNAYENIFGSAEFLYRNMFSRGHRLGVSGRVSSVLAYGRAGYTYPHFISPSLTLELSGFGERRAPESYEGVFAGGTAALSVRVGPNGTVRTWTTVEDAIRLSEPTETDEFPSFREKATALIGVGIQRDTRVRPEFPEPALFSELQVELAGPGLDWSYQFLRFQGDLRAYFPVADRRIVFSSAGYVGYMSGFGEEGEAVPPHERFLVGLGGVRPIRGYREEDVSPVDVNGVVRGGRTAFVANPLEIRVYPYRWIHFAMFVDAGYVWSDPLNANIRDLEWSVGTGVRILLPMGLLRLDYAHPMSRSVLSGGRFIFSTGLPF